MSLLNVFGISESAVAAQSQRLNVVASNIANANSVSGPDGQPYRAREVVFRAVPSGTAQPGAAQSPAKVEVAGVVESAAPPRTVYDPKNPMADAKGYVELPNVNVVDEMVNMLSASRSYQDNVEVMNTTKNLLLKTLTLGE
ncbi:MAG: flagellar basal body rod protein FlgC [Burkholderiales bacterium]|jgi:flagellar basal-body rod protein FlgC